MSTERVNFRLPDELLAKTDAAAAVEHATRTDVVVAALRDYLDDVGDDAAFREELVERYLDGDLGFDVLRAFVGRRDAEAVRASRALLDDADDLADDLAEL